MATYQEQIDNARRAKEAKAKADAEQAAQELSAEQVQNWREALVFMVGPGALYLPESMVRALHKKLSDRLKAEAPSFDDIEERK